jgi:hypothetical protein
MLFRACQATADGYAAAERDEAGRAIVIAVGSQSRRPNDRRPYPALLYLIGALAGVFPREPRAIAVAPFFVLAVLFVVAVASLFRKRKVA